MPAVRRVERNGDCDSEMDEAILKNLVRVGTVTATAPASRVARVKFQDLGVTSDWLPVVASRPYIRDYDGPQETEARSGGAGYALFESHTHSLRIRPWMPKINATVLCIYIPVFNANGFILGELGPLGDCRQWADQ